VLFGKPDGGVGHALLVAALMHHQVAAVLLQRLTQAEHVAVAENREHPGHELALHTIDFDVLVIQKFHQGLGHGQTSGGHVAPLKGPAASCAAGRYENARRAWGRPLR